MCYHHKGVFLNGNIDISDPAKSKEKKGINTTITQVLSGVWNLAVDPENKGKKESWFNSTRPESKEAVVPGVIQQVFPGYHGMAWYWHSFVMDFKRTKRDHTVTFNAAGLPGVVCYFCLKTGGEMVYKSVIIVR